ncbi:MAG: ATP-binding protein, partial [Pyrobaculum sp.]
KKINEAAMLEHVVQEHLYRKFGEVYYHRNKTEIDAVAGPYKVEVKTTRPRRGYPRGVVTLAKETTPRFLLELAGVTTT